MSNLLGKPLPTITGLKFIQGKPCAIGPGKRVYVIEFWATWCGPCRQVFPHLSELYKRYASDREVYFVGITDENDENKIRAFIASMDGKMIYPIALDTQLNARQNLFIPSGARGIPHAFIASDGIITYAGHPADPAFEAALAQAAQQASPRRQAEALPLITESFEQLMGKSVKDLKKILADRGVSSVDCFEKTDLAKRIVERK